MKERITIEVTLIKDYQYIDYSYSYRGTSKHIYTMQDSDGNTYVWKTASYLEIGEIGFDNYYGIKKNDRFTITATVKEQSEYKGEPQTVITRVKVINVIEKALTYEEKKALKQEEQLATLHGNDFVWVMPYKQYKEHYSDCETIYDSYDSHEDQAIREHRYIPSTIAVIIREGRLKKSGTRGEHYSGYQMENELGKKITYRAVSEENALKRVKKDFPDHTWKCVHIFEYQRREW